MQENKKIDENIDDFLKIVVDLNHIQIEVRDEVQAILLLSSLPSRYDGLVETMKYSNSREKLRLNDVMVAARDKEREMSQNNRLIAEGHYARRRPVGKNNNQGNKGKNRSWSKSADGKRVCWICGKEKHFNEQCYKCGNHDPAMLSMATEENLVATDSIADEWVIRFKLP
ncbi:F7F22.12 [Arabidopsis thaliana]|uniref:F7F22.12 n=1 Tax=Arabidopsis thaliana TaxID=3702 RepID=Q9SHM8_ARATH|nr:F7F22.12 [Arabidopsis thaliana]